MINVEITIYMDALGLLLSDKPDIKATITDRLLLGNDKFFDDLLKELKATAEKQHLNQENLTQIFQSDPVDTIMSYLNFKESDIRFNYGATLCCSDARTVAFAIPCTFDDEKYIKDKGNFTDYLQKIGLSFS